MLSDDEIKRILGERAGNLSPEPVAIPAVHIPLPVSLVDVRAVYTLAFNYMAMGVTLVESAEGRAMMAKTALDAIRAAAGLESLIHMGMQSRDDGESPYVARG